MTTIEASQKIIEVFLKNENKHSIKYDDINTLIPTSCDRDEGIAAVLSALESLTKTDFLYKYQSNSNDIKTCLWVLRVPLELQTQTLTISAGLAAQISSAVNNFSEAVSAPELRSNFLNITEQDVMILLDIINFLSNSSDDNEDLDDSEIKDEEIIEEKPKKKK